MAFLFYKLIRPRYSFRYVVSVVIILYVSICIVFEMPLLSSKLPQYSGQYNVGVIDIEAPCEKRVLNDVVLRETGEKPFTLETVLFSLYYPAVKDTPSRRPLHDWVPKPQSLHSDGYARFAKFDNWFGRKLFHLGLKALVGRTKIPARVDVPINGSTRGYRDYYVDQPTDLYGLPEFPVIIFSHGMASGRTSYTHYCAELASRGYIVAAIEHRDGSGPGTVVMTETSSRPVLHFNPDHLSPKPDLPDFKAMQLAFREAEVEETMRVLRIINSGKGRQIYQSNPRREGDELGDWTGRLNLKQVIISGHSFGATLALQTLRGGPNEARPFTGAIILDPGKQSGPLNDQIRVPLLIIHSQSWSSKHTIFHGRPHFSVVKDIVEKVNIESKRFAWFITAKGTTHPSVTDAPLIEPFLLAWTTGATVNAREGVMHYVNISLDFLYYLQTDHRRYALAEEVTHPEYDEDVRDENRKKAMGHGVGRYWQIHACPSLRCSMPGLCGIEKD